MNITSDETRRKAREQLLARGCGATIEAGRRRAVPYTTHCRHCAKDA